MNLHRYVFEIPIYRLSEDKFREEFKKDIINMCAPWEEFEEYFPDNAKAKYEEHIAIASEYRRYCWEYNEIIGWFGLYFFLNSARAEYYLKKGKRIVKGAKQKIEWQGKLFETNLVGNESSNEIFHLIKEEIEKIKKSKKFKTRYIDTNKLYEIGKYINWVDLFKNNN